MRRNGPTRDIGLESTVDHAGAIASRWLSLPAFWASQVVPIVVRHVIAVVAAHLVAAERYPRLADARRGHLPSVAPVVGYTVLSLWIVSRPVVSGWADCRDPNEGTSRLTDPS